MATDERSFRKLAFISSIHTLVLAKIMREGVPDDIEFELMMATDIAYDLADKIPPEVGPATAAFEFIQDSMDMYESERARPGYWKPEWLPEPVPLSSLDFSAPNEVFIDGEWVTTDTSSEDLPGQTVMELKVAALLRDKPALRLGEIASALFMSLGRIRSTLHALSNEGGVTVEGRPARWSLSKSASNSLHRSAPMASAVAPDTRRPEQAGSAEDRILAALRDRPRQRYHELAASVSLSETFVRKHLHALAQRGLVMASKRPARWSLVGPRGPGYRKR